MAGFSDIDRQFQRKAPVAVKLECLNCGGSDDSVRSRRPLWFNGFHDVVLCAPCGVTPAPTAVDLVKERTHLVLEYYKAHPQPAAEYDGN